MAYSPFFMYVSRKNRPVFPAKMGRMWLVPSFYFKRHPAGNFGALAFLHASRRNVTPLRRRNRRASAAQLFLSGRSGGGNLFFPVIDNGHERVLDVFRIGG